jgi:hypothetical protein
MGAWAGYQNVAAYKAKDIARTMVENRDNLKPLKSRIDALLKKETALRRIAGGYTDVESAHTAWMDVLAEVRGAFASDAVWLTDLEPISDYDPAKALESVPDNKKAPNGLPVIKPEFFMTPYGLSSLADMKSERSAQPVVNPGRPGRPGKPGRQVKPALESEVTANAIRIKGYWRENPKSQNLVSQLLKQLSEQSVSFKFKIPDPKHPNQTINLVDDQNLNKIMTITSVIKSGDLAEPFEITLPLAREVVIK